MMATPVIEIDCLKLREIVQTTIWHVSSGCPKFRSAVESIGGMNAAVDRVLGALPFMMVEAAHIPQLELIDALEPILSAEILRHA